MAQFSEGDIFYSYYDNQFHVYKLLKIDEFNFYHILVYSAVDELPEADQINHLQISIYHTPMAASAFEEAKLLLKSAISDDELIGYHEYLRQTNNVPELTRLANELCEKAWQQEELKLYQEAISLYSRAVELLPDFHEAISNRAFCKMELGLWAEAIEDFQRSLSLNPRSLPDEFSMGECFIHLGQYKKAIQQFEKAIEIDPDHQESREYLQKALNLDAGEK